MSGEKLHALGGNKNIRLMDWSTLFQIGSQNSSKQPHAWITPKLLFSGVLGVLDISNGKVKFGCG
jgi:hypothetical protein